MGRKLVLALAGAAIVIAGGLYFVKTRADTAATDAVEARIAGLKERGLTYRDLAADALKGQVVLEEVAFAPTPAMGAEGIRSMAARRAVVDNLVESDGKAFADVTFEDGAVVTNDVHVSTGRIRIERLDAGRLEALAARTEPPAPEELDGLAQGVTVEQVAFDVEGQRVTVDRLVSRPRAADPNCSAGVEFAMEGLKAPGILEIDAAGPLAAFAASSRDWAAAAKLNSCVDAAGSGSLEAGFAVAGVAGLLLEAQGDRIRIPAKVSDAEVQTALAGARVQRLRLVIEDLGQLGPILDAVGLAMGGDRQALGGMAMGMLDMMAGPLLDAEASGTLTAFFAEPKRLEMVIETVGEPLAVADILPAMSEDAPRLRLHFQR